MSGPEVTTVAIDSLAPDPEQPRQRFGRDELEGLARSMAAQGLLYPIRVYRQGSALVIRRFRNSCG